MHAPQYAYLQNRLLARLPENELENLSAALEPIDLPRSMLLVAADREIKYVYFPCSGIGSVVTITRNGQRAEAGMFGREGFSPTSAGVGGTISIHEVIVQVPGQGFRMSLAAVEQALPGNPVFANSLARFIQSFAAQVSFTALCNANCQINERLARWLLMCHDRVDGDDINLTHAFISMLLAVRGPSVTNAIHVLEGHKLVLAQRGRITIRDRMGLEEAAGGAYGQAEEEYHRLLGPI